MNKDTDKPQPTEPPPTDDSKVYRDLRRRNERRTDLARALAAQRRARTEWIMRMMRERRFYHGG